MEENNHLEKLDAFTKKYVKEISQETLATNFTTSIMQSIVKERKKKCF